MTELTLPAPLWRRFGAALYDGLLLLAMFMAALFLEVILRDLAGLPRSWAALRALALLLGLGFFGWFWTHGGQTLGMRSWRLRLRSADGSPVRWPQAMLRYTVALFSWGLAGLGLWWSLFDAQRRTWHDLAAGTEMVVEPKKP